MHVKTGHSVIEGHWFGTSRKLVCDFLLVRQC